MKAVKAAPQVVVPAAKKDDRPKKKSVLEEELEEFENIYGDPESSGHDDPGLSARDVSDDDELSLLESPKPPVTPSKKVVAKQPTRRGRPRKGASA